MTASRSMNKHESTFDSSSHRILFVDVASFLVGDFGTLLSTYTVPLLENMLTELVASWGPAHPMLTTCSIKL